MSTALAQVLAVETERRVQRRQARRVLPGFGLSLGYTGCVLAVLVLLPVCAVLLKSSTLGWAEFFKVVTAPRVVASYRLSFGASLLAAALNSIFGFMLAWSLVRYSFPAKKLIDAMIDLPLALPTAVAGIALAALYARGGCLGALLPPGIEIAYTPLGVLVAMTFVGLPFVVRTVQPVLQELEVGLEEAAASLGARRRQTFVLVLLPALAPALMTGFALAFARALGEYGSVIFIAGNVPMVSEITPLMIVSKLERFDYAGATAVASVMLAASFLLLLAINGLQARRTGARGASAKLQAQ